MITVGMAKEMRRLYRDYPTCRIVDVARWVGVGKTAANDVLIGFRLPEAAEPGEPKNLVQARRDERRKVGD